MGNDPSEAAILRLIEGCLARGPEMAEEEANLLRRQEVLLACGKEPGRREAERVRCAADVAYFIDTYIWQYNPKRKRKELGPFALWDFQVEALAKIEAAYEAGKATVMEKSRDMGASWLLLLFADWDCRFREWRTWIVVSLTADLVESPSMDSCFAKLDFADARLPSWLREPGRAKGRMTGRTPFIPYPSMNSSIKGSATTSNLAVGARASGIIVDEFSAFEERNVTMGKKVRSRVADTADPIFYNGTHRGTHTSFYDLTQTPEVEHIRMHWCEHPYKNQGLYSYEEVRGEKKLRFWKHTPGKGIAEIAGPVVPYPVDFAFVLDGTPTGGPHPGLRSPWYDAQCKRKGSKREVAIELDIDPKGSTSTPFDQSIINWCKSKAREPDWRGIMIHDATGHPLVLDAVPGGMLKLWCKLDGYGKPPAGVYAIGCDVAAGTGNSPSAFALANRRTGQKVGQYSNAHIRPDSFAKLVTAVARLFYDAIVGWEHLGATGVPFGKSLMEDCGYGNVAYFRQSGSYDLGVPGMPGVVLGFRPVGNAKNVLIQQYQRSLELAEYANPAEDALEECLQFRYNAMGQAVHSKDVGADPEAARENHGDLAIADAITNKIIQGTGQLSSKQPEDKPAVAPEDSPLTYVGRQKMRERQREEEEWE